MLGKTTFVAVAALSLLLAANSKVTNAQAKVKAGKFTEAIAILEPMEATGGSEVRSALADAHLKYGDSFFNNANLPPRQKYRPALMQYRQALKYDKANKAAMAKIKLIESIYKSMGMPIPQ
ncbi:MAG TPA: hypothetical protein PKJ41_10140 [Bryobacteraceae bacterium]|nr:hypothetical protein [Bryobacteraceae bacterium]